MDNRPRKNRILCFDSSAFSCTLVLLVRCFAQYFDAQQCSSGSGSCLLNTTTNAILFECRWWCGCNFGLATFRRGMEMGRDPATFSQPMSFVRRCCNAAACCNAVPVLISIIALFHPPPSLSPLVPSTLLPFPFSSPLSTPFFFVF